MSTYAIGDIQGCLTELQRLLELIHFDTSQDVLWCTGDLVNRGPNSLSVLRFVKGLKEHAIVVLGNHDLHLLAVAQGNTKYLKPRDTLTPILEAPDREELLEWLRHRPFLHHDTDLKITMVHAGLPPQWDLWQARQYACEVEEALRASTFPKYLANLYGNEPQKWSDKLTGEKRLRFITNCFTRLRYCDAKGQIALKKKGPPSFNPKKEAKQPWFWWPHRASRQMPIVFGHWATLGYYANHDVYALDSGCVWGGALTALRLEDKQVFTLPCEGSLLPGED